MATVITCRSTKQIHEDNVVELHNRLTKWMRRLKNERCLDYRDIEWKTAQIVRLQKLIDNTEAVLLGDVPAAMFDVCITERLGIKYSSMLRN